MELETLKQIKNESENQTKQGLNKLLTLREQINDLQARHRAHYPGILVDVFDMGDGYTIIADIPGVQAEKLDIAIADNKLYIVGVRDTPLPKQDNSEVGSKPKAEPTIIMQERYRGVFERTLTFPEAISPHNVKTTFHYGMLTLYIYKEVERLPQIITSKNKS